MCINLFAEMMYIPIGCYFFSRLIFISFFFYPYPLKYVVRNTEIYHLGIFIFIAWHANKYVMPIYVAYQKLLWNMFHAIVMATQWQQHIVLVKCVESETNKFFRVLLNGVDGCKAARAGCEVLNGKMRILLKDFVSCCSDITVNVVTHKKAKTNWVSEKNCRERGRGGREGEWKNVTNHHVRQKNKSISILYKQIIIQLIFDLLLVVFFVFIIIHFLHIYFMWISWICEYVKRIWIIMKISQVHFILAFCCWWIHIDYGRMIILEFRVKNILVKMNYDVLTRDWGESHCT